MTHYPKQWIRIALQRLFLYLTYLSPANFMTETEIFASGLPPQRNGLGRSDYLPVSSRLIKSPLEIEKRRFHPG